jgi:Recombination, repair and ssDNA binding protein UvsY.
MIQTNTFKKLTLHIEYLQTLVDTLSEIMENIKWRHQNIGNMIKWRQFTSGM